MLIPTPCNENLKSGLNQISMNLQTMHFMAITTIIVVWPNVKNEICIVNYVLYVCN